MKAYYFKYPKYLFFSLLIYTCYTLAKITDVEIGVTELVFGLIFPLLPVLLSTHFTEKLDKDLSGSMLNWFSLMSPAIVIALEVYFIFSLSLIESGTVVGLLAASGVGAIAFFVLLCFTMLLSVFAKNKLAEPKAY